MDLPKVRGEYRFNESLKTYSGFKTGGNADVLYIPSDVCDLQDFLKHKPRHLPVTIIGNGTNLLIRDGGVRGVTIILKNLNKIYLNEDKFIVECGAQCARFYNFAKENEYSGYEFLGLIPGTLGGAFKTNAGCYGSCICDFLLGATVMHPDGKISFIDSSNIHVSYRHNHLPDDLIFIDLHLRLTPKKTSKEIMAKFNSLLEKKRSSQPLNEKTCGSLFVNPDIMPAWQVIQKLGLQGRDFNGAKMSEKHANFLVNCGSEKSEILESLINRIKTQAIDQYGIKLELEIKIIGEKE